MTKDGYMLCFKSKYNSVLLRPHEHISLFTDIRPAIVSGKLAV